MSGLEALVPLIYHEKQQSGSQLCAQHALNAILQGDYFSAPDLAQFAQQLDTLEGSFNNDAGSVSNNMDDTGFFSVQVLEGALKVWGFTLVRWRSQDLRDQQEIPHAQMAFVLNHQQHWFTLRRFGSLEDPDNGHWFNLNSFLREPEWVGKLYLGMVLLQAENEGYSVFAVLPTGDLNGPLTLPRTEADEVASTLPQPTSSSQIGSQLSTSRVTNAPDTAHISKIDTTPSGFEDEDLELQAALQASLAGNEGESTFAPLATAQAQEQSAPREEPSARLSEPSRRPAELLDESQVESPGVDPIAASMARNKAIMQRMLREQEMALRESYEDEIAHGFGVANGIGPVQQEYRSGESSHARHTHNTIMTGEREEAEAIRKAIEASRAEHNQDNDEEVQDDTDHDKEWHPQPPRAPEANSSGSRTTANRVYDDEDSELQAALQASLEGLPASYSIPAAPPPAPLRPEPTPSLQQEVTSPGKEEEEEEPMKPVEEISPEEMRRRRLARFGGI